MGASSRVKKEELLNYLKSNPFVLAPMAGITDHAFRSFMKRLGAGILVSELVSATGIEYGSQKTIDLTSFDDEQRPVGIQLFGEDPQTLAKAAQFIEAKGADFVDLNFGCPVPKVVKKGAGSAVLKDLEALKRILSAVVEAVQIPVTIKVRTGWDEASRNAESVAEIAYNQGITWMAIHGRTRAQGYNGLADWDYIREVKRVSKIPILGNGDIANAKQAVWRLESSGCDGVLIGRGCLKNPYIFQEAFDLWHSRIIPDQAAPKEIPFENSRNYANILTSLKDCLVLRCDERIVQIQLKKFAAWYSTGYPGAAQFRKDIFQAQESQQVMRLATEFFAQASQQIQLNNEGFLMGGHG